MQQGGAGDAAPGRERQPPADAAVALEGRDDVAVDVEHESGGVRRGRGRRRLGDRRHGRRFVPGRRSGRWRRPRRRRRPGRFRRAGRRRCRRRIRRPGRFRRPRRRRGRHRKGRLDVHPLEPHDVAAQLLQRDVDGEAAADGGRDGERLTAVGRLHAHDVVEVAEAGRLQRDGVAEHRAIGGEQRHLRARLRRAGRDQRQDQEREEEREAGHGCGHGSYITARPRRRGAGAGPAVRHRQVPRAASGSVLACRRVRACPIASRRAPARSSTRLPRRRLR